MRSTSKTLGASVFLLGVMVSSLVPAGQNGKFLKRTIDMRVVFRLCEHLEDAIFYENDVPTSAMPAERTFQFTYYPDLGLLLPEQVRVEVAAKYKEDDEPFVARLALTVTGIQAAAGTREQAAKSPKLGMRPKPKAAVLETKAVVFGCERYCKRLAGEDVVEERLGRLGL